MEKLPVIKVIELECIADLGGARAALAELVAHTVKESGCVHFCVHERTDMPGRFVLWEHFIDHAAFKVHLDEVHTKKYFAGNWTRLAMSLDLRPLGH